MGMVSTALAADVPYPGKKQVCGGKQLKIFLRFSSLKRMQRTHVFQTGTVNTQGSVWKFVRALYKC